LSYTLRWLTIFLSITLLVAYFFGAIVPEVRAWDFSITPTMNVAWPGHPAIYDISVFLDPQEIWGPWTIQLLVSPPELGVTVTFSTNDQAPPFTSTMTVKVDDSKPAGIYTLEVWAHPSYALFPGPDNKEIAVKLNAAMRTDFALSSPSLSPPAPKTGDSVTFSVVLTALSSTIPFTQKLSEMAKASLDGTQISVESLNYLGPTGTPMTVSTATPWAATEGAHTITWSLIIMYDDPDLVLIDPDLSNNEVSLSFSVSSPPPLVIKDFSIDANPHSLTTNQGGASPLTITVHSKMGFSAAVTFATSWVGASPTEVSAPAPGPVTPVPDGTGTTVLTVTAGPSASVGLFTLRVTGTSGSLTHSADISVTISAAVTPTPDMQASSDAIEDARDAINRAEMEGRTVGLEDAKAKLREAENAYKAGDYAMARSLANEARRLAERAEKPLNWLEAYGLYIVAALVALIAIAIVGTLFWRKRKAPPKAVKHCISCGVEMPADVPYCPRCGAKQEQL